MSVSHSSPSTSDDQPAMTAPGSGARSGARSGERFRRYLVAVAVTVSGNWAQNVVMAIVALDVSDSALVAGLAISLKQLPLLLIAPMAGRFIDDRSKSLLVARAQTGAGLLTFALFAAAVGGALSTPLILAYALALGMFSVIDVPARVALIADLVPEGRISRATSAANTASALGRVIGPAVAAVMIAAVSTNAVFALNAFSYLVTASLFLSLRTEPTPIAGPTGEHRTSTRQLLKSSTFLPVYVLVFVVAVLVVNSQVVLLVLIRDVLRVEEGRYGVLLFVLGVGAVAGTLATGRLASPRVGQLALVTLIAGCALLVIAWASEFLVVAIAATVAGVAVGSFATASSTYLQLKSASTGRGQALALFEALFTGASPIGAALAGVFAEAFGAPRTLTVFGLVVTSVALAVLLTGSGERNPLPPEEQEP